MSLPPPLPGGQGSGNDFWSLFVAIFTRQNAREGVKLLASGLAIEGGRRAFSWLSDRVLPHPTVQLNFNQGDPAYDWVMHLLTQDNVWRRSLNFTVTAASSQRKWSVSSHFHVGLAAPNHVDYVPKWDRAHLFSWRGTWVDVVRSGHGDMYNNSFPSPWGGPPPPGSGLKLTFFTRNLKVAAAFVEEARLRYEKSKEPRVTIHLSDNAVMHGPGGHVQWTNVKMKERRHRSTLALEDGVMSALVEDVKEFLNIEDWYTELGIPHHRGYLLYGPPGTGKTSTIYTLAGELGLEIYSLSLSAGHVDDSFLQRCVSSVPRGSIVLVEDIDCAFASRDDEEGETIQPFMPPMTMPHSFHRRGGMRSSSRVTLSGLLNVIDGVGSDEGRLFFATTNHYDRLDPALIRPGRIDFKIEYKRATQGQARQLFDRFFPPDRFAPPGTPSGVASPPSYEDASKELVVNDTKPVDYLAGIDDIVPAGTPSATPRAKYPYRGTLTRPLVELGDAFAASIPPDEFSPAELQGYLLLCKWDPERAVDGLAAWIEEERAQRRAKEEKEERRKERALAKAAAAAAQQ